MKLSDRLTRAGLAFLIFGTCTALLPGNSGNFMTASDACTTGQSHHSNSGKTLAYVGGGLAGAAAIIYFTDPSFFGQIFGHGGGGGGNSGGPGAPLFDPVTQLFQFIYDPGTNPTP